MQRRQRSEIESSLFTPEGLQKVARGWSAAQTPGGLGNKIRILKGCESNNEIHDRSLASLQDAMVFLGGSRGLRCAPTPGYLLQPLRGKRLRLFFNDH
jgi:hypothetical protein